MGRRKTTGADLPPRMLGRPKRTGTYFYYCGPDRREIPLGKDRRVALRRYHEIHTTTGSASGVPDGFSRSLFIQTAKRAIQHGVPMSLTEDSIHRMIVSQNWRCAVTGIKFAANVYPGQRIRPWVPSIDRLIASRGYVDGNVRIVCAAVNIAMNQFGDEIFFRIMAGALNNRKKLRTKHPDADQSTTLETHATA